MRGEMKRIEKEFRTSNRDTNRISAKKTGTERERDRDREEIKGTVE
jgi:hypothetical protein